MMTSERIIATSILRLTRTGSVQKEQVRNDARVSTETLETVLRKLSEMEIVSLQTSFVDISPAQRIKLAIQALKFGLDYEQICKLLSWEEFESVAAMAFEANHFSVLKNFHFQQAGKRWEIDVVGCREPLIVCMDCKHWHHGWRQAAIIKTVEAQIERTRALADSLARYYQRIQIAQWKTATLVPLILSLIPGPLKFHQNVPIVPVLQLQDLINQVPIEVNSLTHFTEKQFVLNEKLTEYTQ